MEDSETPSGGSPAGLPPHAEGQQPEGVLLETERDRRVLNWLIGQVGVEAVEDACCSLAGRRRAYPSNIAKVLGLSPPRSLELTPRDLARKHLAQLQSL